MRGFRLIGGSTHDLGVESGYVLLNWVVGRLGFSFHSFLVFYAAIVVGSVSLFIYRYCENAALGFATFISLGAFVSFFGILRQSLALAIFLLAIPALERRKPIRFFLIVIIAGLFHQSLFIAAALYFVVKLKANKALYVIFIGASLALTVITPVLYNNVVFPIIVRLGRYYYLNDFEWNNMFAVMMVLAVFFMFFFKNREREDNSMQCGFLMSLPLQALAFYLPIFSRLSGAVFFNFVCVLLPNTLSRIENRNQRFQANTVAYIGLLAFYLYTMIDSVLVPYVPFWAA
jgi:hypothetical protein